MEEEKKEPQKDRVIQLMSGLEIIPLGEKELTVKNFLEESLSEYNAPIKVQASFPPLDQKLDNQQRENGFVRAFMMAYANHLPLEISPDDVWLAVCQGFCAHILKHSEELRKEFVDFDGKKQLEVDLDDFTFGSPDNDWTQAFTQFSSQIKDIIGAKMHGIFVHNFSTTTPLFTTIYEATLLSAMQNYFSYTVCTACGIPAVRMKGKPEDWKTLRDKVAGLAKYGVEWWITKLLKVIDKFVAAAVDGQSDPEFWNAVCKIVNPGESGDFDGLNGWIGHFFPYLNGEKNEKIRDLDQILLTMKTFNDDDLYDPCYEDEDFDSLSAEKKKQFQEKQKKYAAAREIYETFPDFETFSVGVTEAPFKWEYYGEQHKMKFISGFLGIEQTADGYVKPQIGWAIGKKTDPPPKEEYSDEEEEEEENEPE